MRPIIATFVVFISFYANGQPLQIGHSVDSLLGQNNQAVISQLYRHAGIDFEFVQIPTVRSLIETNSGQLDAIVFRVAGQEKEYTNLIRLQQSHYSVRIQAFSKKNLPITSWSDLADYRIAFISGFLIAERNTQGMQVIQTQQLEQSFDLLASDRVDVVIAAYESGIAIINDGLSGIFPIYPALYEVPVYHYLHSSQVDVANRLNQSLSALRESGALLFMPPAEAM